MDSTIFGLRKIWESRAKNLSCIIALAETVKYLYYTCMLVIEIRYRESKKLLPCYTLKLLHTWGCVHLCWHDSEQPPVFDLQHCRSICQYHVENTWQQMLKFCILSSTILQHPISTITPEVMIVMFEIQSPNCSYCKYWNSWLKHRIDQVCKSVLVLH